MPIQNTDIPTATEVSDHTALLGYLEHPHLRWNAGQGLGTPVIVSYSFVTQGDLPDVSQYYANRAYAYSSFSAQDQQYFRQAIAVYEAVTGVVFVETTGDAMINVLGAQAYSVGGGGPVMRMSETASPMKARLSVPLITWHRANTGFSFCCTNWATPWVCGIRTITTIWSSNPRSTPSRIR